jgi:hypothetical protein
MPARLAQDAVFESESLSFAIRGALDVDQGAALSHLAQLRA